MSDDSSYEVYEILPEYVYGMRISADEIEIYLSDCQKIVLSQSAVEIIGDVIDRFRK
jgi:hypothetical protein